MDDAARRLSLRRARAWGLVVVLLAALLGLRLMLGVSVETGILALLPHAERDPVLEQLVQASSSHAGRTVLLVVFHAETAQAVAAARSLAEELESSESFAHVAAGMDESSRRAVHELYFPHRHHLLDQRARALLATGTGAEALVSRAEERLYGPESSLLSRLLAEDPLLLFPAWLEGLDPGGGRLAVHDGVPVATSDGEAAALVTAVLAGDPFEQATQTSALSVIEQARASLALAFPDATVGCTGLVVFAAAAREGIAREISIIGLGSVAGVLALVLLVFRTPRALLIGLMPGLVGILCGLAVSLWIYPTFHALMLVFGASLIGVCIDYAFHFMATHRMPGNIPAGSWSGEVGLRSVRAGITLGALTSVMAYAALALTPFPGLRQMALLSSVGIVGAWATVVCWFPLLLDSPESRSTPPRLHRLAGWVLQAWASPRVRPWLRPVGLALVVAALAGVILAPFDDDVRRLQRAPAALVAEDERLQNLAGGADHSRFVLVEADSTETMLQRQEDTSSRLDELVRQGRLATYRSLAQVLPSLQRQRADHDLLLSALRAPGGRWKQALDELGFAESAATELERRVAAGGEDLLTPEAWLASEASVLHRPLWLGATARGVASLVQLEGISSLAEIDAVLAGIDGVTTVDRVADVSDLFRRYRGWALVFVGIAYLAILLLLVLRYGARGGATVMAPPLLAAALTLAWVGAFAGPLNVMHCLALLLILGLGVDYAVFFAEGGADRTTTYFALILSALTTMLSFGLLALSTTPAVQAIGLVTLSGTLLALLLAPVAIGVGRPSRSGPSRRGTTAALALAMITTLCGCSSTETCAVPLGITGDERWVEVAEGAFFPLQEPSSLGQALAVDQSVVVHHAEGTHRFQARFECDTERLVVVGLTASAGRAFVLILEGGKVTTQDHTQGRLPLDMRYMLADIQLAFWPHLPPIEGLVMKEERGTGEAWSRVFLRGDEPVIRISYESRQPFEGRLVLEHFERGYRLEVTSAGVTPLDQSTATEPLEG